MYKQGISTRENFVGWVSGGSVVVLKEMLYVGRELNRCSCAVSFVGSGNSVITGLMLPVSSNSYIAEDSAQSKFCASRISFYLRQI